MSKTYSQILKEAVSEITKEGWDDFKKGYKQQKKSTDVAKKMVKRDSKGWAEDVFKTGVEGKEFKDKAKKLETIRNKHMDKFNKRVEKQTGDKSHYIIGAAAGSQHKKIKAAAAVGIGAAGYALWKVKKARCKKKCEDLKGNAKEACIKKC